MKIGILSDLHLGNNKGRKLFFEKTFDALKEAFEKLKNCDLIICAGDVFESPKEPPYVLYKAKEIWTDIEFLSVMGNHDTSYSTQREKSAFDLFVSLKLISKICEKRRWVYEDKDVNIVGIGWVPEKVLKDTLFEMMNFAKSKRKDGKINILVLHQFLEDVEKYLPNFDLIILGHFHKTIKKPGILVPGSITITSLSPIHLPHYPKVFIYDTEKNSLEEIPLETALKGEFYSFIVTNEGEAIDKISEKFKNLTPNHVVKIVLSGEASNFDISKVKENLEVRFNVYFEITNKIRLKPKITEISIEKTPKEILYELMKKHNIPLDLLEKIENYEKKSKTLF